MNRNIIVVEKKIPSKFGIRTKTSDSFTPNIVQETQAKRLTIQVFIDTSLTSFSLIILLISPKGAAITQSDKMDEKIPKKTRREVG